MSMNMNMHDLKEHERERPFAASQIACRICDQVFLSSQALINHIETHMVDDQTAASPRQTQLSLMPPQRAHHHHQFTSPNPNFPRSNIPSQTPLLQKPQQTIQNGCMNSQPLPAERKNVVVPRHPNSTPRSIIWDTFPVPPLQHSSLSRKSLVFGPQVPRNNSGQQFVPMQRLVMEERSRSDFTKPLIDQLQKPIPDVEREDGYNGVNDAAMLDLSLKL